MVVSPEKIFPESLEMVGRTTGEMHVHLMVYRDGHEDLFNEQDPGSKG